MRTMIKTAALGGAVLAFSGLALAGATAADAAVSVNNGIGHVDKGDVQTALHWNNGDFDKNQASLRFTGTATRTFDNVLTCGPNADNKVVHVTSTATGSVDLTATKELSANGKQVTGWNLTGPSAVVAGSNDLNKVMQATFTACLPDKPYTEMTAEELRRLPVKVVTDSTGTTKLDGLAVNGVALTNTPVV